MYAFIALLNSNRTPHKHAIGLQQLYAFCSLFHSFKVVVCFQFPSNKALIIILILEQQLYSAFCVFLMRKCQKVTLLTIRTRFPHTYFITVFVFFLVLFLFDRKKIYYYFFSLCWRFESGVHRVQRNPITEKTGKTHTSTITVAILPEAEEVCGVYVHACKYASVCVLGTCVTLWRKRPARLTPAQSRRLFFQKQKRYVKKNMFVCMRANMLKCACSVFCVTLSRKRPARVTPAQSQWLSFSKQKKYDYVHACKC